MRYPFSESAYIITGLPSDPRRIKLYAPGVVTKARGLYSHGGMKETNHASEPMGWQTAPNLGRRYLVHYPPLSFYPPPPRPGSSCKDDMNV